MAARSVTGVAVACLVFLALGTRPAAVAAQAQMSVDAEGEPVLVPGVAVTDPVDGTWVYGDEVSVTIRVTNFDVGTDGSVCVSASWLMDGEDADWSCYSNAPSGVLTTNVYGAKNATFVPHLPFHVKPGEYLDLKRVMNGSFPQLTNNDATTMSFFAPTLFWFMNHNFKFATITRPLTGAVIEMPEGDFEGEETMELDIGVAMAQPHVAGNLAPELCVTVDHAAHMCGKITQDLSIPGLRAGPHHIALQVRAHNGHYYGAPSEIDILLRSPSDPRDVRAIQAEEPMPKPTQLAIVDDAVPSDICHEILNIGQKIGFEPIGIAKEIPGPGDATGPCVLDRVEVAYLSSETLHGLDLEEEYTSAAEALQTLKETAVRLAGLDCDPAECVEEQVELQLFEKNDFHPQRYDHIRAECERDVLRIPVKGRTDEALMAGVDLPDCAELELDRAPRTHTVLVYLSNMPKGAGGHTFFPMMAQSVQPIVGRAVVVNQCYPGADGCLPDPNALYTSNVVDRTGSVKYVAKVFITAPLE